MTDGITSPAPQRFLAAAWILGTWRAQRFMWAESWCKLRGRALPSVAYAHALGAGQRFPLRRGSWMGVLVPMVVFSQFVDVLLAQGLLHVAIADPAARWAAHALLLLVSMWTVVWAVSLRSAMAHVDHVVGERAVTLAIGLKHLCRIPLAQIADVRVIDHKSARGGRDWYDVHGLKPRNVTPVAFLDAPTLLIQRRAGAADAWRTVNGVRKPVRQWVAVYVDQAEAMRQAIAAAVAARENGD